MLGDECIFVHEAFATRYFVFVYLFRCCERVLQLFDVPLSRCGDSYEEHFLTSIYLSPFGTNEVCLLVSLICNACRDVRFCFYVFFCGPSLAYRITDASRLDEKEGA